MLLWLELGALRLAGGPARVEDHRRVGLPRRDARERRGRPSITLPSVCVPSTGDGRGRIGGDHHEVLAVRRSARTPPCPAVAHRQLGRALEAEVRARTGVGQVVGDLPFLEQHVERHHGRAGLQDPVVDHREVRQVRAGQRDPVARSDAPARRASRRPGWPRRRPARTTAWSCRARRRRGPGPTGRRLRARRRDSARRPPRSAHRGSTLAWLPAARGRRSAPEAEILLSARSATRTFVIYQLTRPAQVSPEATFVALPTNLSVPGRFVTLRSTLNEPLAPPVVC